MIVSEPIIVNGTMTMSGGAGHWIQFEYKTAAQAAALVATWGVGEDGRIWYNTDTDQWEMWNGTSVVILG